MATVLTIAGSDPSGHRGLQADLRVLAAFGVHGMAVPTALTVQQGGFRVVPVEVELVRAQLRSVLADADVVKVGMCATGAIARMLAEELRGARVVLDPVLVSSSGHALLDEPSALLPLCALAELVTPNLPEAAALGLAGARVLLTGGHGVGETVVDRLGEQSFPRARVHGADTRGTGCRLSSAVAARLALGDPVSEAVRVAGDWLHDELRRSAPSLGSNPA